MSTVMSTSKSNGLVNMPVKFKLLQLCQSNSSLLQIQFVSVNGQVASSHPRTACAFQFVSVIGQVASSHPRTACTYPFGNPPSTQFVSKNSLCFLYFLSSQVASSNTRAACALCCQYSRSSGQFASKNSLHLSNLISSLPSESCYLSSC